MRVLNDDNLLNDSADLYSHRASLTINSVDAISEFLLDVSLTIIQNVETTNIVAKIQNVKLDQSTPVFQMENLNPFPLSLTIWTGASDQVDRNALARFIELVGKDR